MIDIRIDCDEYKTGIVECVYNKDLKIELLEEEVARLKKEMVDIMSKTFKDNRLFTNHRFYENRAKKWMKKRISTRTLRRNEKRGINPESNIEIRGVR